jgi:hypothetical protein
MDDAIRDMHNRELEGRKISVTRAVPMSETRPGTPAAALGGGDGARTREISRYPRDYGRDYGRSYDRGYDRSYSSYDRGYDRGYSTSYDPRYSSYDRGYDRQVPLVLSIGNINYVPCRSGTNDLNGCILHEFTGQPHTPGTLTPPGVTHMAQVAMVVATVATNAAMIALMTGEVDTSC